MTTPQTDVLDDRVERWISTATRGLAEAPARRVKEEILDHVAEAVDAALSEGADPAAAVAMALRDLGDAERVGRGLRRTNLRPWEAKIVGELSIPRPRWVIGLYLLGLIAFVAVSVEYLESGPRLWLFVAGLGSMVLGMLARFWWARHLAGRGRLRPALIADVFGPWFYYAGLVVGSNLIAGRNEIAAPIVYLVAFVTGLGLVAWLWPKIGRQST